MSTRSAIVAVLSLLSVVSFGCEDDYPATMQVDTSRAPPCTCTVTGIRDNPPNPSITCSPCDAAECLDFGDVLRCAKMADLNDIVTCPKGQHVVVDPSLHGQVHCVF
jgi:hypothetical protein